MKSHGYHTHLHNLDVAPRLGERGLKFSNKRLSHSYRLCRSPLRGAWIEMFENLVNYEMDQALATASGEKLDLLHPGDTLYEKTKHYWQRREDE